MPHVTILDVHDLGDDRIAVTGTVEGITEPLPRMADVLDPVEAKPTGKKQPARDLQTGEYLLEPEDKWPLRKLVATGWRSAAETIVDHDHESTEGHALVDDGAETEQGSCHCSRRKRTADETRTYLEGLLLALVPAPQAEEPPSILKELGL